MPPRTEKVPCGDCFSGLVPLAWNDAPGTNVSEQPSPLKKCSTCGETGVIDYTPPRWMLLGLYRERDGFTIYIGRWACRYSWNRTSSFGNGRRWSSGWHDWVEESKLDC